MGRAVHTARAGKPRGDAAGCGGRRTMMAPMDLLFFIRLGPKTRTDQEKLGPALTELIGKDPLFLFEQDPDSGLAVIHGTGKEPLEDIVERLTNEYGVEVDASEPQIAYREAIRKAA